MLMKWIELFIQGLLLSAVECGSHSLEFLSTGRPHPHFEQLAVFDGVAISHCDSLTKRDELKSVLESKDLPDFCRGARVDIIDFVHVIPPLINSTVDVVQRRRGCSLSADGIISAFEVWAVNGMDFISFDPESKRWTSKSPSAEAVKHHWNKKDAMNVAFSRFTRLECPRMIERITLRVTPQNTEFRVFAKPIVNTVDRALLMCHVTTTDKSVSSVHLIGEGASQVSWTSVTGPLPSEDGSVIIRLTAGISISQSTNIGCRVQTGDHNMTLYWDGKTLDGSYLHSYWNSLITIAFCCMILVGPVMVCGIIFLQKCVKESRPPPPRVDPQQVKVLTRMLGNAPPPVLRSVIISFLHGAEGNTQREWEQWEEKVNFTKQHFFDPEYFAGQVDGPLQ